MNTEHLPVRSQPAFTCSKLTIKPPEQCVKKLGIKTRERHQLRRSGVFVVDLEQISHCSGITIVDSEQVNAFWDSTG